MKVFYSPRQSVASNHSFSPSAGKPALLVAQWRRRWPELEIVEPTPVTLEELCLAHQRDYVEEVLACRRPNGFGNQSEEVARSLPWTTGSLVSAARHVLAQGGAACSPTSGFHHAGYGWGSGFCTFNGLMVAALLAQSQAGVVGILDCDFHYGNGTDDILAELGVEFVRHFTTGGMRSLSDPDYFLDELPGLLASMEAGLLLYQAGADAHLDDPLGGWMTTEQLRRRDRLVFEFCAQAGVPVVWNLAGGYQSDLQKVLDLHHATMEECLRVFPPAAAPQLH